MVVGGGVSPDHHPNARVFDSSFIKIILKIESILHKRLAPYARQDSAIHSILVKVDESRPA